MRIYRGRGTAAAKDLPCLLFLHGGGWVIGDLDSHDGVCRRLANDAACCVVAVDYRLAPEHRFPAGVEDAAASLAWIAQHAAELRIDPNFTIPAWNEPLPAERQQAWKKNYGEYRRKARETRSGILYEYSQRSALEVSEEERRREYEARWARGGANFTHAFNDIFVLEHVRFLSVP